MAATGITPEPTTIKVTMSVELKVDRARWDAEYGTHDTIEEVREQVTTMAFDAAVHALAHLPVELGYRVRPLPRPRGR